MHHIAQLRNDRLCVGIDLHKDTLTAALFEPRTGHITKAGSRDLRRANNMATSADS